MVYPRDVAGNAEEEEDDKDLNFVPVAFETKKA